MGGVHPPQVSKEGPLNMSVSAPKNTLAYHRKGRPLALKRNLGGLPVVGTINPMKQFASQYGKSASPESEAIWFYMANHAVSEIEMRFDPDEPLPAPVVDVLNEYNKLASAIAARAFYYLLLITCRESRHCKKKAEIAPHVSKSWGAEAMKGIEHYPDHADISAVCNVFTSYTPNATLQQITEAVRYSFYTPGGYHGGYGGKAWGKVSDCLVSYVNGEYTAEMMLDTVWTLCHNNGPIFNKGMLYGMYGSYITEILDIQRSGQIPQLVLTSQSVGSKSHVKPDMVQYAEKIAALFPDSEAFKTGALIDWHKVEALGSVKKYGQYKDGGAANTGGYKPKKPSPSYSDDDHYTGSYATGLKAGDAIHALAVGTDKDVFKLSQSPKMQFKKLKRSELKK